MGSTAAEREEFLSSLQLKSGLFLSCRVYTHSTAECSLTHNGMRYVFDKSAFSHSLTSAEEKIKGMSNYHVTLVFAASTT